MDKTKRKTPIIRFKGFNDDWEQRNLRDLLIERNVQHSQNKDYPLVSFTVERGVTPKTDRYEREQLVRGDKLAKKYKATELDDIVYNPANLKFGAIARNKYGKAVFSPIYVTFEVNANLALSKYIERIVTRQDFIQYALRYQQGTVYERQSVSPENLLSLSTSLPSIVEQEVLGIFFDLIDNLITLHQRKLDKLGQLKKTMLANMFPKTGEVVPEFRFMGFTDAWEQRKLGDFTTSRRGSFPQPYGRKEWFGGEGSMPFVQVVDVGSNLQLEVKTKQRISQLAQPKSVFVEKGTVIVTLQGSIGRVAITQYDAYVDRTILIFESYEERVDSTFWAYTIQSKFDVEKERAPGGTIKTITIKTLSDFNVYVPQYDEQKFIGEYLKQIDNTITLYQRKLESLQELKKTMLKYMFV